MAPFQKSVADIRHRSTPNFPTSFPLFKRSHLGSMDTMPWWAAPELQQINEPRVHRSRTRLLCPRQTLEIAPKVKNVTSRDRRSRFLCMISIEHQKQPIIKFSIISRRHITPLNLKRIRTLLRISPRLRITVIQRIIRSMLKNLNSQISQGVAVRLPPDRLLQEEPETRQHNWE